MDWDLLDWLIAITIGDGILILIVIGLLLDVRRKVTPPIGYSEIP